MKQEKLTKEQKIEIAKKHFDKFAKIKTDINGQLELFVLVMYDILNEVEDYYLEKLNTDKYDKRRIGKRRNGRKNI